MNQEVFKPNIFMAIILPIIIFIFVTLALLGIYNVEGSLPIWALILYIIPVVFAIGGQTNKVIVEDGVLRYEHGFISKKQDEVLLKSVSRIDVRVVEEWSEDSDGNSTIKKKKYAYVLDDSGRTFFSFNADFIGKRNRQRFENAVTAFNSIIEIS